MKHVPLSSRAERVVRKTLADGTEKEYRYDSWAQKLAEQEAAAPATGQCTLSDLIRDWQRSPEWHKLAPRSRDTYARDIAPLTARNYAKLPLVQVERSDLSRLRNRIAEQVGHGAAASFLTAAGSMFGWALDQGWKIQPNLVARMRKGLKRGAFPAWSEAELQLALPHLPERLRRALLLAAGTGQRRSDLIAMGWDDYDGETIKLVQIKTGVKLTLPCPIELRAELDAWRLADGGVVDLAGKLRGAILRTDSGKPWQGNNLSAQLSIRLAQIPGFPAGRNIHGLRKLAAATLAQAGCSAHEIMSITGHSTLAMVELYTRSVEQQRLSNSAADKLAAYRLWTGTEGN